MRAGVFLVGMTAMACACVAETVERKKPRRSTIPELGFVDPGGGEVRYSSEGWGLVVGTRRMSAKRRMAKTCRPLKPKIVEEFEREDVQVPYAGEDLEQNLEKGLDHYQLAPYHHIVFECVPQEKP